MKKINIIYLMPELKGASGGAKVIYNHSAILNKINKDTASEILHLKKKITYKIQIYSKVCHNFWYDNKIFIWVKMKICF